LDGARGDIVASRADRGAVVCRRGVRVITAYFTEPAV
jgi:hypothetical protein